MSKNKFEIFNTFYLECHLALPSGLNVFDAFGYNHDIPSGLKKNAEFITIKKLHVNTDQFLTN